MRVRCHKCGSDQVFAYPGEASALCPDCCARTEHEDGEHGHQYEYERAERDWYCVYCGDRPPQDWYDWRADP